MTGRMRVGTALVVGLLGFAAQASAQIPGMPLFANPNFRTGLRVHADLGQPTESGTKLGDLTLVQGGATLALGPIGLGANVATNFRKVQAVASGDSLTEDDNFTGSAIAQLRVAGGGRQSMSLSIFGGASADITARQVAAATQGVKFPVQMTFPVGVSLGLRIPLGLTTLSVWGAPRYAFTKRVNCPDAVPAEILAVRPDLADLPTMCDATEKTFRWSAGADLPILGIFSIRAAYDSGKINGETVSYWGIGASIGIGGMR